MSPSLFFFVNPHSMMSRDTIDWMVDGANDLSEVWQNPVEQATGPVPSNVQEAVGEIALE